MCAPRCRRGSVEDTARRPTEEVSRHFCTAQIRYASTYQPYFVTAIIGWEFQPEIALSRTGRGSPGRVCNYTQLQDHGQQGCQDEDDLSDGPAGHYSEVHLNRSQYSSRMAALPPRWMESAFRVGRSPGHFPGGPLTLGRRPIHEECGRVVLCPILSMLTGVSLVAPHWAIPYSTTRAQTDVQRCLHSNPQREM